MSRTRTLVTLPPEMLKRAQSIPKRKSRTIPPLQELVAQITPENRYGETATGPARGKETLAPGRFVKLSKS
jgi:hypothetical protein